MPETERKSATARAATRLVDAYELAQQIDGIRADLQSLSSTVRRIANNQLGRFQDKAGEAMRQNPLSVLAIAAGLGFLFGVFTRR
jgi:ElaB/YqjD/DUF883 family membrane-anchored ribosome-binding protein